MAGRVLGSLAILAVAAGVVFAVPSWRETASSWLPPAIAGKTSGPVDRDKRKVRAVPVKIAAATRKIVATYLEGVGTVKARSTVAIKSRIEGQITAALVHEGQTVRKGDILFKLDARPLQARLKEVQANLARSNASHTKAVSDVKRLSNLSAKGYSPQTSVDDAKTQVDTLAASARAAAAEVEIAQLNLEYATIQSPIDGRVGRILMTPGNIVKPNDTQPLLIITETKPVYVSFGVPEQYIDTLRERMAETTLLVEVSTQSSHGIAATGRLFFINNQIDTATGTIELLALFDNQDERLVPGQFIRARVRLTTLENAVVVHRRTVQINQNGNYVWVVLPGDTVELRAVETGPDSGEDVVISTGLQVDENVVTDGQLRLFVGAKVAVIDDAVAAGGGKPKPSREKSAAGGKP